MKIPNTIHELLDSPLYLPISTPPLGVRQLMELNTYAFQSALDWTVKIRYDNKHKIRGNRNFKKSTKTLGDFLGKILDLCEYCDTPLRSFGIAPFPNALEWFQAIFLEFCVGFQIVIYEIYTPELFIKPHNSAKRQIVRQMQAVCTLVSTLEPPNNNLEPNFVLLLGNAIKLAESSKHFKDNIFEPFIISWRKIIDVIEKCWVSGYLSDDWELFSNKGRGRHTQNLTKEYEAYLMRNYFL